jgi:hypothetical protein
MTGFEPDDVEEAGGGEHDDRSLLDRHGPVTGALRAAEQRSP